MKNIEKLIKDIIVIALKENDECKNCDINLVSKYWEEIYNDLKKEPSLLEEIIKKSHDNSYKLSINTYNFVNSSILDILDKLYVYDSPMVGYLTHKKIETIEKLLNNKNIKFNKIKDDVDYFLEIDNDNCKLKIYVESPFIYLSLDYKNLPSNQHNSYGLKYANENSMITDILNNFM